MPSHQWPSRGEYGSWVNDRVNPCNDCRHMFCSDHGTCRDYNRYIDLKIGWANAHKAILENHAEPLRKKP